MKKKKKTVVLFDEVVKTKRRGVVAVLPWGGLPHKEPVTLRFRRPSLAAFSAADFELVEPKERSFVEVNTTPLTSGARELREFRPVVNLTTCSDNLYNQKVCSIAKVLLLEEKFYVYEIVSSYVARNSSLKQDPRSSTCSAWRRNSTAAHSLSATDTHRLVFEKDQIGRRSEKNSFYHEVRIETWRRWKTSAAAAASATTPTSSSTSSSRGSSEKKAGISFLFLSLLYVA